MKTLQKLQTFKNADLLLLCGEMSAQELRTLNAFKNWVVNELRVEQIETVETTTPSKTQFLSTLDQLEGTLLDAIASRCPKDCEPDSTAIPTLNHLEEQETQALDAIDTLKDSIDKLL